MMLMQDFQLKEAVLIPMFLVVVLASGADNIWTDQASNSERQRERPENQGDDVNLVVHHGLRVVRAH